jgi:5-methylcytosine-specific restriction endonuclease McrA
MGYQRHYEILIDRARNRKLTSYSEKHHVIPRCLGGGDESQNIVRLTPEEHYVAHQLLAKIHPTNRKLVYAAWAMCIGEGRNNKRYAWIKNRLRKILSETHKGRKMPEWNKRKLIEVNTGRPCSEETRKKISEAQIGKVLTEDHRRKLSESHKGKKPSEETRMRMSEAGKKRVWSEEVRRKLSKAKQGVKTGPRKATECPHCGKVGAGGIMKRWHFERCKVVNGSTEQGTKARQCASICTA